MIRRSRRHRSRRASESGGASWSTKVAQAFRELDARAPRVRDESEIDVEYVVVAKWLGGLDPLRLELRQQVGQVLHLEADMIVGAAGGRGGSRRHGREVQTHAGQVRG